MTRRYFACALAAACIAGPASAATFATAVGSATVTLLSAVANVGVTRIDPAADFDADASGDASASATADGGFTGDVLTSETDLSAMVGPLAGDAFAFGDVFEGGWVLENSGATDATVDFEVAFSFSVDSGAMDDGDAFAEILYALSGADFGDLLLIELLSETDTGGGPFTSAATHGVTVTVPAFDTATLSVDLESAVLASDVTPIPLPAAGWMLVGALGLLTVARRRA